MTSEQIKNLIKTRFLQSGFTQSLEINHFNTLSSEIRFLITDELYPADLQFTKENGPLCVYRLPYIEEEVRFPHNINSPTTIAKAIINKVDYIKCKDNDNNIYYAKKGIILNKDANPLVMFGNNGDEYSLIINPVVYENNKRIMEKFIIDKIIPCFLENFTNRSIHICDNMIKHGKLMNNDCISKDEENLAIWDTINYMFDNVGLNMPV